MERDRTPLSLILCDIDFFKPYNDTYGHQAGDECLKQVAVAIQKVSKRPLDFVARYGGEEFAVILPNTNIEGALLVAEAIKQAIANLAIPHKSSLVNDYVTLSLGVISMIPTAEQSLGTLIAHADKALYAAKKQGRNRAIACSTT
jgi:diguanylate cyclase (GGDEF)-like protein